MKKAFVTGLVLALTIALMGWMITQVSEYPGVERFVEISPEQGHAEEYEGYSIFTGTKVEIGFKEYKLMPHQILIQVESLPATITFILHNDGRFSHDFHLKGQGIDIKTPKFAPRRTHEFQITFEQPGEYEISCPLSNHAERGMQGTLVVSLVDNV